MASKSFCGGFGSRAVPVLVAAFLATAALAAGFSVVVVGHQVAGNTVQVTVRNDGSDGVQVAGVAASAVLASGQVATSVSASFTLAAGETATVSIAFSDSVLDLAAGPMPFGMTDSPGPVPD